MVFFILNSYITWWFWRHQTFHCFACSTYSHKSATQAIISASPPTQHVFAKLVTSRMCRMKISCLAWPIAWGDLQEDYYKHTRAWKGNSETFRRQNVFCYL